MVNLTDIQIGSILLNQVSDIPSTLSGAPLWNIIDNEIYFAEQYTNTTIGTTSIAEKYQPAIISLALSSVLRSMELAGIKASSITLDSISISKSQGASSTSQSLRDEGMEKLSILGQDFAYYKALG